MELLYFLFTLWRWKQQAPRNVGNYSPIDTFLPLSEAEEGGSIFLLNFNTYLLD